MLLIAFLALTAVGVAGVAWSAVGLVRTGGDKPRGR